jgi:RNA 3'-terminal phosphate cyclase (ATP)
MSPWIVLDGAAGEGGGQILRTALALSAITGRPFRIENIRAKRKRPGLLQQHLTAVRAAAELCRAQVEGAAMASTRLAFRPGSVRGGNHRFSVGTAGSAALVCQTVLPMLLASHEPSEVTFEGGTHNPSSPTYDFLEGVFFATLRRMGARIESEIFSHGFYPAGGGSFFVRVEPTRLEPIELTSAGPLKRVDATVIISRLPSHIAERELRVVAHSMDLEPSALHVREVRSPGPGNVLQIEVARDHLELVTSFGERGKRAEQVAADAVAEARALIDSEAPVGEHLSDQLIVPLALAGRGAFVTLAPSSHMLTNVETTRAFLDVPIAIERDGARAVVRIGP